MGPAQSRETCYSFAMSCPLIPERPILVSPSLAASIGLDEAVLLGVLNDLTRHVPCVPSEGCEWYQLDAGQLRECLPFWDDRDIQRVSQNLRAGGQLQLRSAPYVQSQHLIFAFQTSGKPQAIHSARDGRAKLPGASLIPGNWRPDQETVKRICQHNIAEEFIFRQVPEFVTYWRDSGEAHRSWGAKFHSHVIHQWQNRQPARARKAREAPLPADWKPSQDAIEILVQQAGINARFVHDAIPEFVLYWRERGDSSSTWNTRFITHTRRQWLRFNSALEHDTEPRRIAEDWQPSGDVLDILAMANIDTDFALRLVPEFVLYWRESNQLNNSWNTRFLQHVKFHWARSHAYPLPQNSGNHEENRQASPAGRTRDRSLADDLSDHSWIS